MTTCIEVPSRVIMYVTSNFHNVPACPCQLCKIMSSVQETQHLDRELSSELTGSPVNDRELFSELSEPPLDNRELFSEVSGDGTRMSHSSSLFVCTFSLVEDGQNCLSSAGM